MLEWTLRRIDLPLKYTWNIARNQSDSKVNLLVTVSDGRYSGTGEAAPNIRYNETPGGLEQVFQNASLPSEYVSPAAFDEALDAMDLPNALRFAVESAYLHYCSARGNVAVEQLLGLPAPAPAATMYTIPILEPGALSAFYHEHGLHRFRIIKLKTGRQYPLEAVRELASFCSQPVVVDANEAFTEASECLRWMEKIRDCNILFIEQPLPSDQAEATAEIKKHSPFPLVADESITSHPDFSVLARSFHGVNMKLMKAGGYLRGMRILQEAKRHGLFTMIGCMVETSLGISSALRLSSLADHIDLDSFLLLQNEPFGLVSEQGGILTLQQDV